MGWHHLVAEGPASERVIRVDREALVEFLSYRARAFESAPQADALDALSEQALDSLAGEYVEEEALYREAVSLGLDRNDYVIKQRLVQSMRFASDDFATAAVAVSDEDLRAYYADHQGRYYHEPTLTFTHVFLDAERHGEALASRAAALLTELRQAEVSFAEATGHGDRFPYNVNYVQRGVELIRSHFGSEAAGVLLELTPSDDWQGPVRSSHGLHLVRLEQVTPGVQPSLDDVRSRVRADAEREAQELAARETIPRDRLALRRATVFVSSTWGAVAC